MVMKVYEDIEYYLRMDRENKKKKKIFFFFLINKKYFGNLYQIKKLIFFFPNTKK